MLGYLSSTPRIRFPVLFRWAKTPSAFWDNRCAQHRAMWTTGHTSRGTPGDGEGRAGRVIARVG